MEVEAASGTINPLAGGGGRRLLLIMLVALAAIGGLAFFAASSRVMPSCRMQIFLPSESLGSGNPRRVTAKIKFISLQAFAVQDPFYFGEWIAAHPGALVGDTSLVPAKVLKRGRGERVGRYISVAGVSGDCAIGSGWSEGELETAASGERIWRLRIWSTTQHW